jgi:molybdopterin-guanine dinucleotide biosynthesis protein A
MGVDKATLPADRPFPNYLAQATSRLASLVAQVGVSGRSEAELRLWPGLSKGVIAIPDSRVWDGPAIGVEASLRVAQRLGLAGILVTPVDMPDLDATELRKLIEAWQADPGTIVGSFGGDRPEPLVAIYPVALLAELAELIETPHRSLFRFLCERPAIRVELPKSAARNINRPEDLCGSPGNESPGADSPSNESPGTDPSGDTQSPFQG